MSQRTRIVIGVIILLLLVGGVLAVDALQRSAASTSSAAGDPSLPPGSIPIYLDGLLAGTFVSEQLEQLEIASFVDAEEGKTQEGPRLADVLLLYVPAGQLNPDTVIVVRSSGRGKAAELTWAEVEDPDNEVQFDLSGRGTLKLVSVLERMDVRDEWIQDVDRIDVINP